MRMIAIHAQDGKEGEENQIGVRAKPMAKPLIWKSFSSEWEMLPEGKHNIK